MTQQAFQVKQDEHFAEAARQRFTWQVTHPVVSKLERKLLSNLRLTAGGPISVLEVGCGEGANIANLSDEHELTFTGVDYSEQKIAYLNSLGLPTAALVSDARALPFQSGTFDLVFMRDLIHHIPATDRRKVVQELLRVCKPVGRVVAIEANGANPVIHMQARILKEESGTLEITPERLRQDFIASGGFVTSLTQAEPLPLRRILFHYRFGLPILGRVPGLSALVGWLEAAIGHLMPRRRWSYIVLSAIRNSEKFPEN